jgi:hypothetical protein
MSHLSPDLPVFFGAGQVTQTLVSVTDASTALLAALDRSAGKRVRVTIQNRENAVVFVRVGTTATAGTGGEYVLKADTADNAGNGGTLELPGCQCAVNAIVSTGTANVAVMVVTI